MTHSTTTLAPKNTTGPSSRESNRTRPFSQNGIVMSENIPEIYDIEIEQATLGAIMLQPGRASEFEVEDWFVESHREIFQSIRNCKEGAPTLVVEDLRRRRVLTKVGGLAYVSRLFDHEKNPTLDHWAIPLRRWRQKRELFYMASEIEKGVAADKNPDDIVRMIESRARNIVSSKTEDLVTVEEWPQPPIEDAWLGLAGDFVKIVEPHTESDPIAILVQFLTVFGSMVGRSPHFMVEATRHGMNLFTVLVGPTGRARKGTSYDLAVRPFDVINPTFRKCRKSGLSSGEGLIAAVKNDSSNDGRLLVTESEFAKVLRIAAREGNTLSPLLRQAWDGGDLSTLTKTPDIAIDPHISIIGHVTRDDLRANLDDNEAANGFGNRFLWCCARRSKKLPLGGKLHEVDFGKFHQRLKETVDFAQKVEQMSFEPDAARIWEAIYDELTEGPSGLLGAIIGRAEAQVVRLACVYALLDKSRSIAPYHLRAAHALWKYSERSAASIFGTGLGDRVADTMLAALKDAGAEGMTSTEISTILGRNVNLSRLNRAFSMLVAGGRVVSTKDAAAGKGRPPTRWFLKGAR